MSQALGEPATRSASEILMPRSSSPTTYGRNSAICFLLYFWKLADMPYLLGVFGRQRGSDPAGRNPCNWKVNAIPCLLSVSLRFHVRAILYRLYCSVPTVPICADFGRALERAGTWKATT